MKRISLFKKQTKEKIISAFNTFLSGFLLTVAGLVYVADLNAELLNSAFWISVSLAGVRAGVKAVTAHILGK